MKLLILCIIVCFLHQAAYSQPNDSSYLPMNSADQMIKSNSRLTIGGYGEVHYNQLINSSTYNNGKLDVHRMVMLFGYKFNNKTQFITEIEFEHIKEVYVEQAFLQYKLNRYINFRGGLLLIPMGIINEYHEPVIFNGVERPLTDKYIAPTTWREIGVGIQGNFQEITLKYQLYLVNGFSGYTDESLLNGKNGFRNGRQKGAESFVKSPNLTWKLDYYGLRGLNLGISGYFGKTQSSLYSEIEKNDLSAIKTADSSIVGLTMLGADVRYQLKGLQIKGQFYYSMISNTLQYNHFSSQNGNINDLGNSMFGYYLEAGYNIFRLFSNTSTELISFLRYEKYNTQHSTEEGININRDYNNTVYTTGISWKITRGAIVKTDVQFIKAESDNSYRTTINAGFGVMF